MKLLFLAILLCLSCLPTYSQINCNNIKASGHPLAGLFPNLLNIIYVNQGPKIGGNKISETYTVNWGDNAPELHLSQWFNSLSRSYAMPGTYIIKMKLVVHDSVYNITCVDSTYDTVVVGNPYCDRLKASIAVSLSNGVATMVNNCGPEETGFSSAQYYYTWDDNASGQTSFKTPLTHTYKKPGTHKIRMIFTLGNAYKICKDTADTTITVTVTGIKDMDDAGLQFALYPNPANDNVSVNWTNQSDDVANITVTDISGKQAINSTARMNGTATIGTSKLQPGLYFITVTTKNDRAMHKLIIE
jgi:hypothetical protein